MSTDTENGVASAENSREEETKEERKEKKTPRKRAPSEKKEGERKSERAPKQITPFKPPEPKDDEGIKVPSGKGTPIGDIPNCVTALKAYKAADKFVGKLHRLMFGTGGKKRDFKQNIRLFKGFAPGEDRAKLVKKTTQSKLEMKDLRPMCHILDLERSGTRDELIESIVDFLMEPKSSGKAYKNFKEVASSSGSKKKGQKRKASSKKKDKDEKTPKAPSGYMTFVKAKRPSVVAKHPAATFGEVGKLLGKKWMKLSDSEKAEWTEKGRKLGPSKKAKKEKKKKTSSKKSKKDESSSSDEASGSESSSEEEEEEALSEGIRAKIKAIIAGGAEQLTIRQVKEQLKSENFADEVEKKGAEIKKFVHKCVESQ